MNSEKNDGKINLLKKLSICFGTGFFLFVLETYFHVLATLHYLLID